MQNDNSNFKNEFKKRLYKFVLKLIKFIDTLPKDPVYFNYSLKSSNESKLWIALLRGSACADIKSCDWFLIELDEIAKVFGSSILTLKGRK